jgi:hypothetical protein
VGDQLGRETQQAANIAVGVPVFDMDGAAFDVSKLAKAGSKTLCVSVTVGGSIDAEIADLRQLPGLLRASDT